MSMISRRSLFATATVVLGAIVLAPRPAAAQDGKNWIATLHGTHRMLFDAPATANGVPLVHLMNYYDTYNSAFKVADKDIDGILTFYGFTTFHGLTDAMWSKYNIGAFLKENDAKGVPFTANPWRAAPTALGMVLPQASIEAMQKRGATFLLCNNALQILSGMLANAQGLDPKAVYADMKAHILPGVTLVPGMVIAVDQAQRAGISYHRQ
ncbi:MAG: hypothetical protein IPO52_00095 [Gemmatimonadetes bacterium]|nr:hypothetical protein [Gemmatimonadota bacterium]MBP6443267.1 hypothetical protein [Gemmatimonadales bacterium]MBP6569858.1 hypothetical protein [Gemmatimonadales bacterium]MBP7619545.1 hypothetical protein [Gemmatimonadales bacterium]